MVKQYVPPSRPLAKVLTESEVHEMKELNEIIFNIIADPNSPKIVKDTFDWWLFRRYYDLKSRNKWW